MTTFAIPRFSQVAYDLPEHLELVGDLVPHVGDIINLTYGGHTAPHVVAAVTRSYTIEHQADARPNARVGEIVVTLHVHH